MRRFYSRAEIISQTSFVPSLLPRRAAAQPRETCNLMAGDHAKRGGSSRRPRARPTDRRKGRELSWIKSLRIVNRQINHRNRVHIGREGGRGVAHSGSARAELRFEAQTRTTKTSRFIHIISSDTYRDSITQEDGAGISEPVGLRSLTIAAQSETPTHSARLATLCLLIRCFRAAKRLIMSKGESIGGEREGKGWLASEERGGGEEMDV